MRSRKGGVTWPTVTQVCRVNCGGQKDFLQIFYAKRRVAALYSCLCVCKSAEGGLDSVPASGRVFACDWFSGLLCVFFLSGTQAERPAAALRIPDVQESSQAKDISHLVEYLPSIHTTPVLISNST